MIAVLGVLAMFAFVFLPIILQRMGGRGPVSNPLVVKTELFGNLTQREVDSLSRQRMAAIRFFGQVQRAAVAAGGTGNVAGMFQRQLGDASKENVVDTWLRANHAERDGIEISDNAINQFIREVT
ncbi:MAG TPA: hypothetical protein VE890_14660, partial [Thermoguttaceae bacterium]|nr:hypothetical protein [Thermoguttaceae bacterium]